MTAEKTCGGGLKNRRGGFICRGQGKDYHCQKTKNKQTAADKPTGSDNQTPNAETGGEVAQKPTAETAQTATGGGETATADDALAAAQKEAQETANC